MLETILAVVCAGLVIALICQNLAHRKDTERLKEYKALFEISDADYKISQEKVQNLLVAANNKDVLLERGANALTTANIGLQEQTELMERLTTELDGLKQTVQFQEEQYKKLMNQKKSSEVRTGKITEQISPFLNDYPLNPQTARFIGDPIDFVHFDDEKITFVEVKSGKSQLSTKQRQIRDLIKDGKVEFTIYRVEGSK